MNLLDEKRLNENNFSIRHQIKRQKMSLLQLEHKLKEKRTEKPKLVVPRGKMMIKAKAMVMRVKNDKAILDEIQATKHRSSSGEGEEGSPKYKISKNVPNLIIQSQVQNDPGHTVTAPPPPHSHYAPPAAPIIYQHTVPAPYPQPIIVEKPVKYIRQPVHYVEEYVHHPGEPVYATSEYSYRESRHPAPPPYHSPPRREYLPARGPAHSVHSPPHHDYLPARGPVHSVHRREYPPQRVSHLNHSYQTSSYHAATRGHSTNYPDHQHETREKGTPLLTTYPRKRKEHRSSSHTNEEVVRHDISSVKYKVLVSNLHPNVTLDDVQELFLAVDSVGTMKMLYPGVAEVTYTDEESAAQAVDRYHNRDLDGQPMQLSYTVVYPKARRDTDKTRSRPQPETRGRPQSETRGRPQSDSMYNRTNGFTRGGKKKRRTPAPQMSARPGQMSAPHQAGQISDGSPYQAGHRQVRPQPRKPRMSDTESVHSFTITM